jgi:hypothetical protein
MRLWIDENLVIDKWEKSEESADGNVMMNEMKTKEEGKIDLVKGTKYPIKIDYFETKQNASIRLFWSYPDQEKQIVPNDFLFTNKTSSTQNGLKAVYKSKTQYICYTKNHGNLYVTILDWPGNELVLPLDLSGQDVTISMLGREGNFSFENDDGNIVIDLSDMYLNDLPGLYAWTFKFEGLKLN